MVTQPNLTPPLLPTLQVSTYGVSLFVDDEFEGTVFAPTDEAFEAAFEALGVDGGDFVEESANAALVRF